MWWQILDYDLKNNSLEKYTAQFKTKIVCVTVKNKQITEEANKIIRHREVRSCVWWGTSRKRTHK